MKAISVRNPFAHWILCGKKEFEFRTWRTKYRGDLLICSSAKPKLSGMISGCALCVVCLEDVLLVTEENGCDFGLDKDVFDGGRLYAWHLTNLRCVKPFPVKGKLNFFEVEDSLIEVVGCVSDEEGL